MALVLQYRTFKANLLGYTEVAFDVFRGRLIPLRQKRGAWSDDDDAFVRELAGKGAGRALQVLFGANHAPAKKVLGEKELATEPMSKTELDEHMRELIKSCLVAGWSAERFLSFAVYLDSKMTPTQLVERDREARRKRALEQNTLFQIAQDAKEDAAPSKKAAKKAAKDDWDDGEAPEQDKFAEMYRGAGPVFKRAVNEHLAAAAKEALAAAKKSAASAEPAS